MDALGRVVGNECLDISNLMWVVWNLSKRFAKDLMLQRGSISVEVQRVTVDLKEVLSKIKLRQAEKGIRWKLAHHTSMSFALGHFPGITALANMQYINVSLLWQQVILFSTLMHFLFYCKNELHSFKVNMSRSNWAVCAGTHCEQLCVSLCVEEDKYESLLTSLTKAVAMPAKATGHPWQQWWYFPSSG